MIAAMLLLWRRRAAFDSTVMPWLLASVAAAIVSEFTFTLYIGVTNDLARRAWEHREGMAPGFTKKYGVNLLV